MHPLFRLSFLFVVMLFDTCEEKEVIPDTYKGMPVEVRETNYGAVVPFVNYHRYLETTNSTDSLDEDFVTIAYDGKYLSVSSHEDPVQFGPDWLSSWELLKVYHLGNQKVAFMDYSNRYMSLHPDNTIRFTAYDIDSTSTFKLVPLENEQFAIKAPNQLFICSENGYRDVTASRNKIAEWESFTIHKLLPSQ